MDSRGWISIPLIASFNRIKSLTYDLQLVKDVLTLSSIVEVRGDWVRIHRWTQYVLPDAPPSHIEPGDGFSAISLSTSQPYGVAESILTHPPPELRNGFEHQPQDLEGGAIANGAIQEDEEDEDGYVEDEDEDDVEIVLGGDANRSWTPEKKVAAADA